MNDIPVKLSPLLESQACGVECGWFELEIVPLRFIEPNDQPYKVEHELDNKIIDAHKELAPLMMIPTDDLFTVVPADRVASYWGKSALDVTRFVLATVDLKRIIVEGSLCMLEKSDLQVTVEEKEGS